MTASYLITSVDLCHNNMSSFFLYIEILATRKGMWSAIVSRRHSPLKIYPFGANANEVMLYGTLAMSLKDGRSADVDWAARAVLAEEKEGWKLAFYQVFSVSLNLVFAVLFGA